MAKKLFIILSQSNHNAFVVGYIHGFCLLWYVGNLQFFIDTKRFFK